MAQQFGRLYMRMKISTGLVLLSTLGVVTGCGKRSEEWKKGRAEYVKEQERKAQESYAASELSKPQTFEGREFLKDKRNVIEGVEKEFADSLVEKFYKSGAKKVSFTSVDEDYIVKKVNGKRMKYVSRRVASILVVELPELIADRQKVFETEAKLAEKMAVIPMQDVEQKYMVLELD